MRHTFSFIQSTSPTGCRFLYCDPLQDGRWFQDGVTFEDGEGGWWWWRWEVGGGWEGVSGGSGVIDTLLVVANYGGAVSETGQSDPLFDRSSEAALGWTGGSSSAATPWNKPGSRAGFFSKASSVYCTVANSNGLESLTL